MRYGLKPAVEAGIIDLARQCEIEKLILFGSRARGTNRERSDIALAVQGGRTAEFAVRADEELPTLLMFGVVDLDKPIQAELCEEIRRDGIVLYERCIMKAAKEGDILDTTEQAHQQDLERLKSLRYMDDDFMTVCLADNFEGVELILRIVLGQEDIAVISVRTQAPMKNLQGRSAILDVHAADSAKREFDVEIQRTDAGAGAKRARHNSSLLDAHILTPGDDTEDIPDSYVIFITENDVMQGSQPVYPVERYVTIGEKKVLFGDGSHILYVNGKYRGNDEIGKLMHDFSCNK